ncbi:unnamed protein product, partial [Polarella glacialis]
MSARLRSRSKGARRERPRSPSVSRERGGRRGGDRGDRGGRRKQEARRRSPSGSSSPSQKRGGRSPVRSKRGSGGGGGGGGGGSGFDMKVMPQDLQRVQMLAQQYQQTKTVAQQLALQQEQQAKQGPPNPEVEAFLAQYPQIQPHAAARLRALPRDAQMQVLMLGGLGKARDPTAMLLGRIRNVDPFNATWVPRNPGMQPFPAPAAAPGAAMMNMQVASMVPANPSAPPPPPVETPKARAVEAPKKVATTYEDENEYDKWAAMAEGQLAAA